MTEENPDDVTIDDMPFANWDDSHAYAMLPDIR
jgi:hypothetical protein